jgi:hypothetical protein
MRCITCHQFGGWHGFVLNARRRVVYATAGHLTEYAARAAANAWMIQQRGRAA